MTERSPTCGATLPSGAGLAATLGTISTRTTTGRTMPGGSDYPGPQRSLELYTAAVESSAADADVKGAKNPYTSRNGHMFSFLTADGIMALRLPDDGQGEFAAAYDSGPVVQYGSVMQGYVSVPDDLLADTTTLTGWFERSYDWIGTLPSKATKKKS